MALLPAGRAIAKTWVSAARTPSDQGPYGFASLAILMNRHREPTSQPELGDNPVSLRAPNRPLSGSVAFLGHTWGLTLFRNPRERPRTHSTGLANEPARTLPASRPWCRPLAGFYFWGGARAGFSANRRGGYPPPQPRKNQPGYQSLSPNSRALTGSCPPHPLRSRNSRHLQCCPFWCPRGIPAGRHYPRGTGGGAGDGLPDVHEIALTRTTRLLLKLVA
jgi:hypothetical protein